MLVETFNSIINQHWKQIDSTRVTATGKFLKNVIKQLILLLIILVMFLHYLERERKSWKLIIQFPETLFLTMFELDFPAEPEHFANVATAAIFLSSPDSLAGNAAKALAAFSFA